MLAANVCVHFHYDHWPLLGVPERLAFSNGLAEGNSLLFQAEGRVGSVSIKQKLHENDALIIRDYLATVKIIKIAIRTRVMGLV